MIDSCPDCLAERLTLRRERGGHREAVTFCPDCSDRSAVMRELGWSPLVPELVRNDLHDLLDLQFAAAFGGWSF